MSDIVGYIDGQLCNRNGCSGVIEIKPSENCSCHLSPPCFACTEAPFWCPECGWQSNEDETNE